VEGLASLEVLGNASVVPVVIFLTQILKKYIVKFKYRTDAVALALSFILCIGWAFYNMPPSEFYSLLNADFHFQFKYTIDQLIIGFATWLAASKLYDLGHGAKKRDREVSETIEKHITEKGQLANEIIKLKNGHGDKDEQVDENPVVSGKLREILEG
jgi:hypothetical protein